MALESMTGSVPPERAYWLRAIFLERERIANHLGDIGQYVTMRHLHLCFIR